jgi:uncharacterized YigZ family protein
MWSFAHERAEREGGLMKGISESASCELDIRNSRFLAEAFPVSSQEDARALLKTLKEKYADATHVVHAFVIGPGGGILGCSDDGEPSGTAGRPVLDVLKGSGITGIMVTVSRWFGGTLLGTGGLVKAYGDSAKAVLALVHAEEIVPVRAFTVDLPYDVYERVKRELGPLGAEVSQEEFGTCVSLTGTVRSDSAEAFAARIADVTAGKFAVALSE